MLTSHSVKVLKACYLYYCIFHLWHIIPDFIYMYAILFPRIHLNSFSCVLQNVRTLYNFFIFVSCLQEEFCIYLLVLPMTHIVGILFVLCFEISLSRSYIWYFVVWLHLRFRIKFLRHPPIKQLLVQGFVYCVHGRSWILLLLSWSFFQKNVNLDTVLLH
jgi:hypothetical protein